MNKIKETEPIRRFSEYVTKSAESGTLINLVFSAPVSKELIKIKSVLKVIAGARVMQAEYFRSEGRVSQENISFDTITEMIEMNFGISFRRVDLNDKNGSASLMISKKGKITLLTRGKAPSIFSVG